MMKLSVRSLIVMTAIMGYMGHSTSARGMGSVVEVTQQSLEGIKHKIGKVLMKFLVNHNVVNFDRMVELLVKYLSEYEALCGEAHPSIAQFKQDVPRLIVIGKTDTKRMLNEFTTHINSLFDLVPDHVKEYANNMSLMQQSALFRAVAAKKKVDNRPLAEIERIMLS